MTNLLGGPVKRETERDGERLEILRDLEKEEKEEERVERKLSFSGRFWILGILLVDRGGWWWSFVGLVSGRDHY